VIIIILIISELPQKIIVYIGEGSFGRYYMKTVSIGVDIGWKTELMIDKNSIVSRIGQTVRPSFTRACHQLGILFSLSA
jgi:hypothetical protein